MKNITFLFTFFLFLNSIFSQEIIIDESNISNELSEKSKQFFFEYLIDNKINNEFKSVKIGTNEYLIKDSTLLEKYFKYSYFKRPNKIFLMKFNNFLLSNVFNSNEENIINNLNYIIPYSSPELYNYMILMDGMKINPLKIEIASPFELQLNKKEIHRIYFKKNGLIDKVEELVESSSKKDTLLVKKITTYEYYKNTLKNKKVEYKNIHTSQTVEITLFLFDKTSKLTEVKTEKFTYNNGEPNISTTQTIYTYKTRNLTEVKTNFKGKILNGYTINYDKNIVTVNPLMECRNCEPFRYTLIK
jgi:hypothetical protein